MQQHGLAPADITSVIAHVHQGALDVLGAVVTPRTVHQAKFNMGTVLGLVAHHGYAGVTEFEQGFDADAIAAFREKVAMAYDSEVDAAYPVRWIGKVTVTTTDGRVLHGRVDEPKGDPGNTLSRDEIASKLHRLAAFSGAATEGEAAQLLGGAWHIAECAQVGSVFDASSHAAVPA
jgi:2-methylcitrate dehydratase PrpD